MFRFTSRLTVVVSLISVLVGPNWSLATEVFISDFDDGTLQGWTKVEPFGGDLFATTGGGNPGGFMVATDTGFGGEMYARYPTVFTLQTSDVIVWDEFLYGGVQPPDQYGNPTLAHLFGEDGTIWRHIAAMGPVDAWTTQQAPLNSGDWTRVSGTASFPDVLQSTRIGFSVDISTRSNGSRESGIDNVRIIPEPSTLVLLAMGAVGLLAYAWRRRRAF